MVGLGLSFKNSGLDLDRKIWQCAQLCYAVPAFLNLNQWSSTFIVQSPLYRNFAWKSPPTYDFSAVWKYWL